MKSKNWLSIEKNIKYEKIKRLPYKKIGFKDISWTISVRSRKRRLFFYFE